MTFHVSDCEFLADPGIFHKPRAVDLDEKVGAKAVASENGIRGQACEFGQCRGGNQMQGRTVEKAFESRFPNKWLSLSDG